MTSQIELQGLKEADADETKISPVVKTVPTENPVGKRKMSRGSRVKKEIETQLRAPIFIPHHSKCCIWCGRNNHHCRLETFELIESHRFQAFMLFLLVVDVTCVTFELLVQSRILPPGPDLDSASLAIPKESVCGDVTEVMYRYGKPKDYTDHGTVEDCCQLFHKKYPVTDIWGNGNVGDVSKNVEACIANTKWTGPDNSSTTYVTIFPGSASMISSAGSSNSNSNSGDSSSNHHRRMLLSASSSSAGSGHHGGGPRCFKQPGHQYRPPPGHTTVETALHWTSNLILLIFLVELLTIMYTMGVFQFFCSCRTKINIGDLVTVKDAETGDYMCPYGSVEHVNHHTGSFHVRPIEMNDIDPETNEMSTAAKERRSRSATMGILGEEPALNLMNHDDDDPEAGKEEDHRKRSSTLQAEQLVQNRKILTDIPYWTLELYAHSEMKLYEGSVPLKDKCDCCWTPRNKGKIDCCCSWFNVMFVLDFFIVLAALVAENLNEIFALSELDFDATAVTEAGLFIIFVRSWRILRVFHGIHEGHEKLNHKSFDISNELNIVKRMSLMTLYGLQKKVQAGEITHKDFFNEFQLVFGNVENPSSDDAARGCGKNYFKEFQMAIEEEFQKKKTASDMVKKMSESHLLESHLRTSSSRDIRMDDINILKAKHK